jgi:hypothetical protein
MQQAIEERRDRGGVAQQLAPVVDRPIGRQQCGRALVPPHDDLQQIFGRGVWQLAHPEVVDDQQRHGGEIREIDLAGAIERGVREFLEQRVRLAIDDPVPCWMTARPMA